MEDVIRFLQDSPLASRIALPVRVVVRRLTLGSREVGKIMEGGTFTPSGEEACDLVIGGQCIARGKIVRKRGGLYFKAGEIAKGGNP